MNKYNPRIHHRKSIRLKGYDYSQAGFYFITICCQDRIRRFGHVENGIMQLNEYGRIAYDEWIKLSERFPNFELDAFQIMPNHMHGIVALTGGATGGATLAVAPHSGFTRNEEYSRNGEFSRNEVFTQIDTNTQNDYAITNNDNEQNIDLGTESGTNPKVSDIIGAYKSIVSNGCLNIYKSRNETMGKLWQRNYYERIIRDELAYRMISNYIIKNPEKWAEDKFHIKRNLSGKQ